MFFIPFDFSSDAPVAESLVMSLRSEQISGVLRYQVGPARDFCRHSPYTVSRAGSFPPLVVGQMMPPSFWSPQVGHVYRWVVRVGRFALSHSMIPRCRPRLNLCTCQGGVKERGQVEQRPNTGQEASYHPMHLLFPPTSSKVTLQSRQA